MKKFIVAVSFLLCSCRYFGVEPTRSVNEVAEKECPPNKSECQEASSGN